MPDGKKTLEELREEFGNEPIPPDTSGQINIDASQVRQIVEFQARQIQDIVQEAIKLNNLGQAAPAIGEQSILQLVDRFVADKLLTNVFTDTDVFTSIIARTPDGAFAHIPNTDPRALNFPGATHPDGVIPELSAPGPTPTAGQEVHSVLGTTNDPRLLNFNPENAHPHSDLAGSGGEHNSKRHVIPDPVMHDVQPNYTGPGERDGTGGVITPSKLAQIYQQNRPPSEPRKPIQQQAADIETNTPLVDGRNIGGGSIPNTQTEPLIEKEATQIPVGHTPQPRAEREKLYEQANDRNRHGSRIQELLDFHKSVEQDRSFAKEQQYDSQRRADVYVQRPEEVQVKSNIGGTEISNPTIGDERAARQQIPAPDLLFEGPDDAYEGERPRDLQNTPADPNTGHIPDDQRADIYRDPNSNPGRNQIYATKRGPTVGDERMARGQPPGTPSEDAERSRSGFAARSKGHAYSEERREVIYNPPFDPYEKDLKSNIGGGPGVGEESIPTSKPTAGDIQGAEFKPPTRDLLFDRPDQDPEVRPEPLTQPTREEIYLDLNAQGVPQTPDGAPPPGLSRDPTVRVNETPAREFAPLQGQIRRQDGDAWQGGNTYRDNDGFASIPGVLSNLRFFDVIAAASWLRNVGQEVFFVPRQKTDLIERKKESVISTETVVKSLQWILGQFLLTSFNPTDPQGYGGLNALWNPLSLPLSVLPLLRSTPFTNITIGAAVGGALSEIGLGSGPYKQNTIDSAKASEGGFAPSGFRGDGERLLQMRQGDYEQSLDANQIAQLRFANSGYKGDILGTTQGTIEGGGLIAGLLGEAANLLASSIENQVDQAATGGALSAPGDRNLYALDTPYASNAILPLDKLEEELDGSPPLNRPYGADRKVQALFKPYAFPGGAVRDFQVVPDFPLPGDVRNHYWKASPTGERVSFLGVRDAPGLNAATTPVTLVGSAIQEEKIQSGEFEGQSKGFTKELLEEDAVYIPFMFQDLRDDPPAYLYFRAFLKPGMAETFTPDWQVERYYGRVDQVPIYQGTLRTLAVSFDVVAWSPADLPVMWRKLQKLQSMVYPSYNKGGFLKSGPIIRMRIGDLFANQDNRGLPGYVTSMDWSYDDGIWNLKTDFKVPRKVSISIGFTVLHDGNPGIYPFKAAQASEIDFNSNLDEPDESTDNTQLATFGAGKITNEKGKTQITVNPSEIRKIFERVRNKES